MALRARARPCDSRTCGNEESRAEGFFVADAQRRVAPLRTAAVQIGAVHEVGDPHDATDTVVRHPFEVIDEILARVVFLGHRPIEIVLEADMAVDLHLRGYD